MIFPNPTSRNKNICYNLAVHIYTPEEKSSKVLDTQKIEKIEIFNKLNQFYTTGTLVYADDRQIMDKYFNKPLCLIQMFFDQIINIPKADTSITNKEESFTHRFIVKKFTILSREEQLVRYQIDFVDVNWWKMVKNVNYTTYKEFKHRVGDILQTVFEQVGIELDTLTVQEMETSIDYITNSGDNPMDVFKYVTSRLLYEDYEMSESIVMMSYNLIEDKYFLYNMKNQDYSQIDTDKYPQDNMLILSMYGRDSLEKMIQRQQVGLGTMSLKSKTDFLRDIQTRKIYSYDIDSNSFDVTTIDSKKLQEIYNNTLVQGKKKLDIDKMQILDDKNIFEKSKIFEDCSYWNNNLNLYDEMVGSLINNDSLVVNMNGNINRFPGADFEIFITNPVELVGMESTDYEEIMKKYQQYTGIWVVSSIRHIIEPQKGLFNDVICLFRNW